jgi:hypothetical protein
MWRGAGAVIVVLSSLAGACGGGGDTGSGVTTSPSAVATLTGSWKAAKAEFVNISNSSQRIEIVSMGTTVTLTLDSSGSYTQKIADPGQAGRSTSGTWTASKDVLQLQPAGMSGNMQFDMTLSGNTLSLNGGHVAFDVNLDGKDEETLAYFTMIRQ